jgi:hypothetical protein
MLQCQPRVSLDLADSRSNTNIGNFVLDRGGPPYDGCVDPQVST